jgi:hypothetical protein
MQRSAIEADAKTSKCEGSLGIEQTRTRFGAERILVRTLAHLQPAPAILLSFQTRSASDSFGFQSIEVKRQATASSKRPKRTGETLSA